MIPDTIASITEWHKRARPTPDNKAFQVQLGCHFEEIAEQLNTIIGVDRAFDQQINTARSLLTYLADSLKSGEQMVSIINRKEFLDAVADQVVTGIGAAYCAGMKPVEALICVDASNWSKFVDGFPVFNEQGKIAKPPTYQPVDLTGCY